MSEQKGEKLLSLLSFTAKEDSKAKLKQLYKESDRTHIVYNVVLMVALGALLLGFNFVSDSLFTKILTGVGTTTIVLMFGSEIVSIKNKEY